LTEIDQLVAFKGSSFLSLPRREAVLGLLLRPNDQRPWSVEEVEREVGETLAVTDAIAALHAAGLLHRCGKFVFASHAAMSMDRLSL